MKLGKLTGWEWRRDSTKFRAFMILLWAIYVNWAQTCLGCKPSSQFSILLINSAYPVPFKYNCTWVGRPLRPGLLYQKKIEL